MSAIDTIQKSLGGATAVAGPSASELTYKALTHIEGLFESLARAMEKRRTRRSLANLSDHQLRDIGVTRYEADREARRSFWY